MTRYREVYVRLKTQIIEGAFPASTPLQSEPELAARFGVSRITIRRALALLEEDGLIQRRHGVGTFVLPANASPERPALGGPLERLITLGVDTRATTLAADWQPAAGLPATALGLDGKGLDGKGPEGEAKLLRIVRRRSADGVPFSYTTLYLPDPLGRLIDIAALDDRPIVTILEAEGVEAVRAEQTISATLAEGEAAEEMQVPAGSPLTRLTRTVFGADERPMLLQISLYRPDLFEYRMTLTRNQIGSGPTWSPV